VPSPASPPASSKVTIGIGGAGLAAALAAVCWVAAKKRHERTAAGSLSKPLLTMPSGEGKPRQLSYPELVQATGGFSAQSRLGRGGSCDVFHGVLAGQAVAVKRLNADATGLDAKQFADEMAVLCCVSHESVCALLGFSLDGAHRCLVLELCTGGALDARLALKPTHAAQAPPPPLPWHHRLRIACDVGSALAFLHGRKPPVLHRDVKVCALVHQLLPASD
jgi:hypothetical protein